MLPVLSDAIDEATVRNKKRQEGLYMGVRTFFGRIAIILQVLTFNLVQRFTGFDQYASTQTDSAIFGIRIIVAIVPIALMIIGIILFYILYDINDKKKKEIQAQLKELNL
jgi:GPH family glycoside/pentoside/hexuronide:cation symporter